MTVLFARCLQSHGFHTGGALHDRRWLDLEDRYAVGPGLDLDLAWARSPSEDRGARQHRSRNRRRCRFNHVHADPSGNAEEGGGRGDGPRMPPVPFRLGPGGWGPAGLRGRGRDRGGWHGGGGSGHHRASLMFRSEFMSYGVKGTSHAGLVVDPVTGCVAHSSPCLQRAVSRRLRLPAGIGR